MDSRTAPCPCGRSGDTFMLTMHQDTGRAAGVRIVGEWAELLASNRAVRMASAAVDRLFDDAGNGCDCVNSRTTARSASARCDRSGCCSRMPERNGFERSVGRRDSLPAGVIAAAGAQQQQRKPSSCRSWPTASLIAPVPAAGRRHALRAFHGGAGGDAADCPPPPRSRSRSRGSHRGAGDTRMSSCPAAFTLLGASSPARDRHVFSRQAPAPDRRPRPAAPSQCKAKTRGRGRLEPAPASAKARQLRPAICW